METSYRQAHGFFVGVDYELPAEHVGDPYPADAFGNIGAANDVASLSEALAPTLYRSQELANEAATRDALLAGLEDTVQAARSRDLVIAYFSVYTVPEHPYEDLYLVPHGFEPNAVLETAVPFRLITAVLAYRKSLLILDVCGPATVGFDMSRYRVGAGSSVMISCGPDEVSTSREFDGVLHGTFTWGLVKSLNRRRAKAKRGWRVSLIDWFDDAYNEVGAACPTQHPLFIGTLSPNLELRSRRATDAGIQTPGMTAGSAR